MSKKTPLYEKQKSLSARFIDFSGYSMPVWYKGVKEEHKAVRERVGIFDINHMGALSVTGSERVEALNNQLTNDLRKVKNNKIQYSFICNADGKILDDLLVYSDGDKLMIIVNCNQSESLTEHIKTNGRNYNFEVSDVSEQTGLLSIQGPRSFDLCKKLFDIDLEEYPYYSFTHHTYERADWIVSRTGYTGERGFELFFDSHLNGMIWDKLLSEGESFGIEPCGLGARDILRLEMGFPLYGNDLMGHTPVELQKNWCVKLDKGEFVGKSVILSQKEKGSSTSLVAFTLMEKGIPRHEYKVYNSDKLIGEVTSGGFSPTLQKGIGLCLIDIQDAKKDNIVYIDIRGHRVPAKITRLPFIESHVK